MIQLRSEEAPAAPATVPFSAAPAAPPDDPLVNKVKTAIDRGVQFLRDQEKGKGHLEVSLEVKGWPGGATSLGLLALLNCGVPPDDPVIKRGLDYLRSAGVRPDERCEEAIALVESKRGADGRWVLENTHPGRMHFEMEDGDGEPSRWNTLRAMRVIDWHRGQVPSPTGAS